MWTDQYARENFTDNARLIQALEDLRHQLRADEDQQHGERNRGRSG